MSNGMVQGKKIAVVTATRAEYGLLSRLIGLLHGSDEFELQLFVTGAHLLPSQGMTVNDIRKNSVPISAEIEIIDHDKQPVDIAQVAAKALSAFAKVFQTFQPDAVVLLGDRYELMGIASAALLTHTPIVHIHGGETTEGAMDEAIRHAVTKMASLHFAAAKPYAKRLIQMGEQPDRVFNVGAPGLDVISQLQPIALEQLEGFLQLALNKPVFMVTYHPVTWGDNHGLQALQALFNALDEFPQASIIWTAANTDESGEQINQQVKNWVEQKANARFVCSLGSQRYLSLLKIADVVVGNSSSGIIEAPACGAATINIGSRQQGRLKAPSIIDCHENVHDICNALNKALSTEHKALCRPELSLYGQGDSAKKMLQILSKTNFDQLKTKRFYDLDGDINAI
ncbi:UDP-N-acetylglucosamine 2-epimerase [Thiomicrorhabdus sediminis]|uniref:UDP-N-acetylglucosamine 2-epimerase n=1 Tax=Thiomicrorhabdus sediminis TaxID=2580412 RepID=UPI00143DEDE7|nr:UDP-N-acetylglucosamine 2-epimerase [Thiomicrorhabdus sediminis]